MTPRPGRWPVGDPLCCRRCDRANACTTYTIHTEQLGVDIGFRASPQGRDGFRVVDVGVETRPMRRKPLRGKGWLDNRPMQRQPLVIQQLFEA